MIITYGEIWMSWREQNILWTRKYFLNACFAYTCTCILHSPGLVNVIGYWVTCCIPVEDFVGDGVLWLSISAGDVVVVLKHKVYALEITDALKKLWSFWYVHV